MMHRWIQQFRPHQWVHQLTVLIVVSGFGQAPFERLLSAPFVSLFGTLAFLLVGDVLHRDDDAEMGRDRLTQHLPTNTLLGSIGTCLSIVVGFSLYYGGLGCLLFVITMMSGTLVYNIAKKKRRLWTSYLGRGIAGVALVGVYQIYLYGLSLNIDWIMLGLCSGMLDIAGNIGGDLRDLATDQKANLKTLPIVYGTTVTLICIVALHIAAYSIVIGATQNVEGTLISLLLWTSLTLSLIHSVPQQWKHAAIHGPKLMHLLWLGAVFHHPSHTTLLATYSIIGILWGASYASYVWSMKRTTKRNPNIATGYSKNPT